MAMSTDALTRASRKLKTLAADAISLPTRAELYERKVIELHAARKRLNDFIERQVKTESAQNCQVATKDKLNAEKAPLLADVDRLERESSAYMTRRLSS